MIRFGAYGRAEDNHSEKDNLETAVGQHFKHESRALLFFYTLLKWLRWNRVFSPIIRGKRLQRELRCIVLRTAHKIAQQDALLSHKYSTSGAGTIDWQWILTRILARITKTVVAGAKRDPFRVSKELEKGGWKNHLTS